MKARRFLRKLCLAAGATAAVLVAVELSLALLWPQATWDNTWNRLDGRVPTEPDELLPFRLVPGAKARLVRAEFDTEIAINSSGFRGPELRDDGAPRVLAVGDSFTFGWGVDEGESYPRALERELDGAEVVNAGFAAGLDPGTYYLWLKERGLALEPDLVLMGLFIGNDVVDSGAAATPERGGLIWSEVDASGLPLRIERPEVPAGAERGAVRAMQRRYRYPVLRNSHLVQLLATQIRRRIPPPADFNHWIFRAAQDPALTARYARVELTLGAAHRLARGGGVPLVVVLMPAREQVLPEAYAFGGHAHMADADLERPQRRLATFFEREGIPYIDLLPAFRAAAGGEAPLYFPIDLHWTAAGNALAAREVAAGLTELGIELSD